MHAFLHFACTSCETLQFLLTWSCVQRRMSFLLHCASWLNAGGVVVLAETFSHEIYRKSLARLFELDENGYLQMYFNATFDVIMSKVNLANQAQ